MIEKKKFWESKTKIAALLIGVSPILVTVGGMLNGSVDLSTGIMSLMTEVGIVLGILGIRDMPFVNKIK